MQTSWDSIFFAGPYLVSYCLRSPVLSAPVRGSTQTLCCPVALPSSRQLLSVGSRRQLSFASPSHFRIRRDFRSKNPLSGFAPKQTIESSALAAQPHSATEGLLSGTSKKSTVGHSCTRHATGSRWKRWETHINCPDWSTTFWERIADKTNDTILPRKRGGKNKQKHYFGNVSHFSSKYSGSGGNFDSGHNLRLYGEIDSSHIFDSFFLLPSRESLSPRNQSAKKERQRIMISVVLCWGSQNTQPRAFPLRRWLHPAYPCNHLDDR